MPASARAAILNGCIVDVTVATDCGTPDRHCSCTGRASLSLSSVQLTVTEMLIGNSPPPGTFDPLLKMILRPCSDQDTSVGRSPSITTLKGATP